MDTTQLPRMQQDVVNLLLGDAALAWVPVFSFKQMVVQSIADENLNIWSDRSGLGKVGTAIEVRMPAVRAKYPDVPGPQLEVELVVRIMEDPVNNTTGLTAESIGLEVLQWLDGMTFEGTRTTQGVIIHADNKGPALKPVYDYPDRFAYDAIFVGELPQSFPGRTAMPALADDDHGTVTLTSSDPSAQIYYTLDNSLPIIPSPNVAAADPTFLYAAPFVVADGAVVRWIALTPGILPSYVARATINVT